MSGSRQRLVVVGNGMAAGRVVEELVTKSPGGAWIRMKATTEKMNRRSGSSSSRLMM